jgi:hypothetical protein
LNIVCLLKSLAGFCALLQIVFLPGFLLVRARRWSDGALQALLLSFALSLLLNFLLVMLLVGLHLYTTTSLLTIFSFELIALLWRPHGAAAWQADVARLTRWGEDCWEGTWLQRALKLGVVALALQALAAAAHDVAAHWGDIFLVWDEVTGWNRWALGWAANQWPQLTMGYPQLLPANFSLTYVFLGTTHVWAFAKGIMPLFPLATLLLWMDLALRTRRLGFLLAIPITACLIKTILANVPLLGYADSPLTFLAATGVYVAVLRHASAPSAAEPRADFGLLLPMLMAAAALTKITGWYLCLALPVLVWRWQAAQPGSPHPARWLVRWAVVTLLLTLPWYALATFVLMPLKEGSINAWNVLNFAHQGRVGVERIVYGVQQLVANGGLPGVLCLSLSLLALPLRTWRWPALLGGAWCLAWSLGMSYDTRNLAPALPLLALAAAMGTEAAFLRPSRPSLLLALTALLLSLAVTNPLDRLAAAQTSQLQNVGDPAVNRFLTQYRDEHEFDGKILSNYDFLPFVPHMAPYHIHEFFYDLGEFKRDLERTHACYLLLGTPWCEASVRDFIDQKLGSGEFKMIAELGRWHFIRTAAPRRVDRWIEATALGHKIGRTNLDFESQSLFVWEANKTDQEEFVIFGGYQSLPAGRYRVSCRIKATGLRPTHPVIFDVAADHGRTILGKVSLDHATQGYAWVSLEVPVAAQDEIEFRCWKVGGGTVQLDLIHYQQLE